MKVYFSAAIFSIIVGFSFLGVKTCISVATPLETLAFRFGFAFLAALIPVVFGFAKINLKGKPRNKLYTTAAFYIGFMVLQTIGLMFSTSIESGIIFAIIPILAKIIAGIMLKESTNYKQNIFVLMSVAAVITMFVVGNTEITFNFIGMFILLLSSLSMAISNVLMRYVRGTFRPFEISFLITGGGFFIFNMALIVYSIKEGDLAGYFSPLMNLDFFVATLYLGVLSTLVSALLMSYMLANMEAVKATIFGNLSTAISIVAGVVILNEPLKPYHIICTVLIIAGVIGLSMPKMAQTKKKEGII